MKKPEFKPLIVSVGVGFVFLVAGTCAPIYAQEGKHEQDARPEKQEQQHERGQQEQRQEPQQDKGQQEHQQQAKEQDHQQQVKSQQEQHQQQAQGQQELQEQAKDQQEHQQQQISSQQKQQQQQTKGLQKKKQKQPKSANQPQQQVKPVSQTQQQAKVGLKKQQANQPSQPVQHIAQAEQKNVWQQHRAQNWQADHRTWQERGGYSGYRIPEDHYHGHFGQYHSFRIYSHSMEIYEGYPRFQYNGYWFGVLDPWPESWSDDWYERDYVYIVYSNDGYYMYNRNHPGVGIAISVYIN
jgi:hypothetical protein